MMMKIIYILLIAFTATLAESCPSRPETLRENIASNQFIISGYVIGTHEINENDRRGWITKVKVYESIKGNIQADTIEIFKEPFISCCSPRDLNVNSFAIIFLNKKEKYYVNDISFDKMNVRSNELNDIKKVISDYLEISKIADEDSKYFKTIDWLISSAAIEPARGFSLRELNPRGDFIKKYCEGKNLNFGELLTNKQKKQLKEILFDKGLGDYYYLTELIYKGNERELDHKLTSELKNLNYYEWNLAEYLMERLKHKGNKKKTEKIIQEFRSIKFEEEQEEKLVELIQRFLDEINAL